MSLVCSDWLDNNGDEEEEEEIFRRKREVDHEHQIDTFSRQQQCADDAVILETLLQTYDKLRIPGGGNVEVKVEVSIF